MSKFCTNCGAKLEEDSLFCEECGARVGQTVPSVNEEYEEEAAFEEAEAAVSQTENSAQRPASRPSGTAAKSGGIPTVLIICALIVLIAAAGVFFLFGRRGKGGSSGNSKPEIKRVTDVGEKDEESDSPYFQLEEEEEAEPEEEIAQPEGAEDETASAEVDGAEIAARLSTTEIANATDFEWFIDYVENGGAEAGCVITDPSLSSRVTDAAALNGGWKAYMFTESGTYGSDVERYLNVEIATDGDRFDLTMNWKYFYDAVSGSSVDESHMDLFQGSCSDGTATVQGEFAKVELDEFYLSEDGKAEYAVGTYYWISGETERIGLMRTTG